MKRLYEVLAAVLVVSLAGQAMAQERTTTVQANTVYVSAEGRFEAEPDTAVIGFHLAADERSSQRAYDRLAQMAEQVRQALRKAGVEPKTAEVGFFSLQPRYEYRPRQRVIGYRATTNITLRLKDFGKVGPVVEQLAEIEGASSHTVNYILEQMDEAKNKAVADAFRRARASAAAVAEAGDRALGELNYASVDTFEHVRPMMAEAMTMRAQAADAPMEEFSPQRITVTARVTALFNLR
jgi:uncharacterized protein YggE